MKPVVYIETSVISYLAARPSKNIPTLARQIQTAEWWSERRHLFELVISTVVIEEARSGDAAAVKRRLAVCDGLRTVAVSADATRLAGEIMRRIQLPFTAEPDAFHVSVAAVTGADYLITWNLKHIAAANHRLGIESSCRALGWNPPLICTPPQLVEA